ncbi:MAG TPA: hypothetical protein VGR00_03010, partial [Thermoanaerobaculia bacterium]|nr:hypothetical protein [Thermoanaerobaculia bacterium]
MRRVQSLLIVVLISSPRSFGATRTWNGSASGSWNAAANWTPSGVPAAGDDLVFPSAGTNKSMTNDIPAPAPLLATLTFSGSGYTASGSPISLLGGVSVTYAFGTTALAFDIAVSSATFTVSSSFASLTLSGNVNVMSTLTAAGAGTQTYSGIVSGPGGLSMQAGNPHVTLSGANTYGGNTFVGSGTLTIQSGGRLGATSAGTTLAGGTLALSGGMAAGVNSSEPLTVSASSTLTSAGGGFGYNELFGPIALDATLIVDVTSGVLTMGGDMSGLAGLDITTPGSGGALFLSGNNSFMGLVTFSGTVGLLTSSALGNGPGANCSAANGTLGVSGGIAVGNALDLGNAGCTLDNFGGDNVWNGPIKTPLNTLSPIRVASTTSLTINGAITGSGFTKIGPGRLFVTSDNPVAAGNLQDGTTLTSQRLDTATLSAGATLGGSGTFNEIDASSGGTVAPGYGLAPGTIAVGTLTLGPAATLALLIGGPGSYSSVAASVAVSLGGAVLAETLGVPPLVGASLDIVSNGAMSPTAGTFAGLLEGAYLRLGNTELRISYAAGPGGNDVVLTVVAPPAATIAAGGPSSFCPPGSVMLTA